MDLNNRFQNQKWYVKLWRFRYYLLVPYLATKIYFKARKKEYLPFGTCWSISKGLTQTYMDYFWTMDEVRDRLGAKGIGKSIEEKLPFRQEESKAAMFYLSSLFPDYILQKEVSLFYSQNDISPDKETIESETRTARDNIVKFYVNFWNLAWRERVETIEEVELDKNFQPKTQHLKDFNKYKTRMNCAEQALLSSIALDCGGFEFVSQSFFKELRNKALTSFT